MDSSTFLLVCLVGFVSADSTLSLQRTLPELDLQEKHWAFDLTTPEIIERFGYPVEIHHVTTEDGYILELHRIPHGLAGPAEYQKVAYLEHCLLCSSADFVMNEPNGALAYILADAGYDVWLSNMRGNTYSRNHTTLDPKKGKFWKFSWDEMALYDVPASLDYVLEETGADGVYYVGWSMGTTVFFAMASEIHEYNDKIKIMAAMAPVAFADNVIGPLTLFGKFSHELQTMCDLTGIGEVFPSDYYTKYFAENFCDKNSSKVEICYTFMSQLFGPDPDEVPKDYLPVIFSHTPAGSSSHTLFHYGQMMNSGKFCKYDHGARGNMKHYGQKTPPVYDLSKVNTPVGIFWGNTDWIANPTDVARLAEALPNVVLNYNVPKEQFSHADFGWGLHAREYVYDKILELFSEY